MVNVLLIFNASAISIDHSSPILLCWAFFLIFMSFISKLKQSHPQIRCGQSFVDLHCFCNSNYSFISYAIGLWMLNFHKTLIFTCFAKIIRISPPNPKWSMYCWSSMLLQFQLLLGLQFHCPVNVKFPKPSLFTLSGMLQNQKISPPNPM